MRSWEIVQHEVAMVTCEKYARIRRWRPRDRRRQSGTDCGSWEAEEEEEEDERHLAREETEEKIQPRLPTGTERECG